MQSRINSSRVLSQFDIGDFIKIVLLRFFWVYKYWPSQSYQEFIGITLSWHEHHDISNHRQLVCSFNGVFRLTETIIAQHYWPHVTSSNGNIFRVTGRSFVRGIQRSPVDSPHKGQWHGALMFSSIWAWTSGSTSKQSSRRWFETPSRSLWRHCNGLSRLISSWKTEVT